MILPPLLGVSLTLGLAAAASTNNYTEWMATSYLSKSVTQSRNYANGVLYRGIELAYNKTQDESLLNFITSQVDAVISPEGELNDYNLTKKTSLDDLRIGTNLLNLWARTGNKRYKIAADTLRHQIDVTPRNAGGGLWHRMPTYPNQMWLDGIYMSTNFYAQWTAWFDSKNKTAWDDIMLQFDLIEEHTLVKESGLLAHGYDHSKVAVWADPVTGSAPHVWNRALGWYFMSLLDILDIFPRSHRGWKQNLRRFQALAKALKAAQDKSGGWWLIMDEPYPSDPRNYIESSGSAMFTYGFLKGIRKGYLKSKDYKGAADKGYKTLLEEFVGKNDNGTLNWEGTVEVGSLSSNGSFEYYVSVPIQKNDIKGAGPFMYASYELEGY
ncbi:glycoside hydrolase family 88/105 protein [Aspergillus affinis]|uniref:glycoside hydrolase family 88/105 protein n=1 Tax=Aspergillus affinis TaxID=1070780 RepID=UPI0022FDCCCB|nr:unsaturated rhamnogalacturonan hydrolase [Aspergillus affinis]KAI9038250.1 unsaturated rhamnogalacturonan hydrolase [Aspergillus affinis]